MLGLKYFEQFLKATKNISTEELIRKYFITLI